MPRSHKPRKRYVPKHVRPDAHLHAIDRVATLLSTQRSALSVPMHAAFDAFRTGHGSARYWCDLADGCNVGEVLAELSIGSNLTPRFAAAQAALSAVHQRHTAGGSWTLRPAELVAIDEAVWAADVQLQHCSQGELHDAVHIVKQRTRGALAGGVGTSTIVCVGHLGRAEPLQEAA